MSDDEQPKRPPDFHLHISVPDDSGGIIQIDARPSGGPVVSIPTRTMGFIQHAGREVGWEAVDAILTYGARLQRDAAVAGVDLIADNGAELKAVERAIFNAALHIHRENLLEKTYKLLSEGKLNRVNAAKLVQDVLQENISVDAWRKAVDKWASDNGKPKLDLPHGRRSRTKPEN